MKKSSKKWIIIPVIVVILALVGYFVVYPRFKTASAATNLSQFRTQAATTGSITSFVGAAGNIRTNQTAVINWQTSGTVAKIDVTSGQVVTAGTVLAELDPASLPQTVLNAQNTLATDQQALTDLLNSNVARAQAEVNLITTEQNLINAQKAAQSKQFQNASPQTIEIAQANLIQAQTALDDASTIYNKNKSRSNTDPVYAAALSQFAAAQQKFYTAQANLQYAQNLPDPLTVQLANAQVDLANAQYLDAKRAWENVKDGPNPTDVAAAQAKVAADQAIINEAKPTAPISGTVTVINNQPGDLVSPNTVAFQIDDLTHMYVDTSVSEVDINKIQPGQKVDLSFDAIPNQTYPGVVTSIASVGTASNGVVNYGVTVELQQKDPAIKPGMTASANVSVPGPQNVLVVPNTAIVTVSGRKVVYIERNNTLFALPIQTGAASITQTQVTGGPLRQGELVVLNPPTTTTTAQATGLAGIFGRLFGGGGVRVAAGGGFGGGGFGGGGNFNGGNRTGGTGGTGGSSGGSRTGGNGG